MLQERLYAEIGQRAAEKDRCELAFGHTLLIKFGAGDIQQLAVLAQLLEEVLADHLDEGIVFERAFGDLCSLHAMISAVKGNDPSVVSFIYALEFLA